MDLKIPSKEAFLRLISMETEKWVTIITEGWERIEM